MDNRALERQKKDYLFEKVFYVEKNHIYCLLIIKFWENLDYEAKDKR